MSVSAAPTTHTSQRPAGAGFGQFVARSHGSGQLVVQPRMGMSDPRRMRAGLLATKHAAATTVGTITVDSYTRVGDHAAASQALADGSDLNGYPIVSQDAGITRGVLDRVAAGDFPVQVRHGAARAQRIVAALVAAGLDATEGGPVSYCLPYSRTHLRDSVLCWRQCCELLMAPRADRAQPHLETFGGCLLGQLCPPSLLIAVSVLEGLFFRQQGLRSISLSYAQQTNSAQDAEAILALRRIAARLLPDVEWHIVLYTYMGMYPATRRGALLLLRESARLAVRTGAARLVVKTAAEAHRIPTIAENVAALETAAAAAAAAARSGAEVADTGIHAEACALVEAVLDLDPDVGRALVRAFSLGYLDVPYCLHPDNQGRSRSYLDEHGRLCWSEVGSMPIRGISAPRGAARMTSADLLMSLSYVQRTFDKKGKSWRA
ncbi:MAG: methylaspartate mutase [Streptosporangiaceae bacterium]|jgi:methylaspartate mutase epsilon subunit